MSPVTVTKGHGGPEKSKRTGVPGDADGAQRSARTGDARKTGSRQIRNTKQEAELLAKSLQCKDAIISSTKVKELEKRNRRLEYEKQRVASLKKSRVKVEKTNAKPELNNVHHTHEKKITSSAMVQTRASPKGSVTTEDADRRERIQRYKDERRKQMAARYGTTTNLSSSEEEEAAGSSSSARKRRRNRATDSSSTEYSTVEKKKHIEKEKKRVGDSKEKVVSQKSYINNSNNLINESDDSAYQVKKRDAVTAHKNAQNDAKMRRKSSGTEKDKSHKRKSNLNRAPFEEPVPPLDDAARRRRRKSDNILSNFGNSELTSVQLVANVSSSSSSGPGTTQQPCPRKESPHKKPEIPDTLKKDKKSSKKAGAAVSEAVAATASVASLISGAALVSRTPTSCESLKSEDATLGNNHDSGEDESQQHIDHLTAQARSIIAHVDNISNIRKVEGMEVTAERGRSQYTKRGEREIIKSDERLNNSFQRMRDKSPLWADDENPKNFFLRKEKESQNYKREGKARSPPFVRKERPKTPPFLKKEEKLKSPPYVRKFNKYKEEETINKSRNVLNSTNDSELLEASLRIDEDSSSHIRSFSPMRKREERPFSPVGKEESIFRREDRPLSPFSRKEIGYQSPYAKKEESIPRSVAARVDGMNKRLAFHEIKKDDEGKKLRDRASSLENDSPRHSPDPYSILKRKSSDYGRSNSPEPHSILKKASSTDMDAEPKPILKKNIEPILKKSMEDISSKPRPILKKKSLTDDELECDLPKSILKAKSGEDLSSEGVVSPTPILKISKNDTEFKSSKTDMDLKPILKRRQTTDAVKMNVESDSDSEPVVRMRSDSAPESAIRNQRNGPKPILKNRTEDGARKERPLSVAERIAGMEAMQGQSSFSPPRVKPRRESSLDRVATTRNERPAAAPDVEQIESSVSQRAAFFSQLEKANDKEESTRKTRGARFATQPVTDSEVNKARRDSPVDSKDRYGSLDSVNQSSNNDKMKDLPKSILKASRTTDDQPKSILKNDSPLSSLLASPEHGPLKSVLKKDSSMDDSKEIKSILKRQSDSLDQDSTSDSSSEPDNNKLNKKHQSLKVSNSVSQKHQLHKEDLAEALRSIEPIKDTSSRFPEHKSSDPIVPDIRHHKPKLSSSPGETRYTDVKSSFSESKISESRSTGENHALESRAFESTRVESLALESNRVESRALESTHVDSRALESTRVDSKKSTSEKVAADYERTAFDEEALIFGTGSAFMDGFILRRPTALSETTNNEFFDSSDSDDLLERLSPTPDRFSHEAHRGSELGDMDASDILNKSPLFNSKRIEPLSNSQRLDNLQNKDKGWQKKIKELDKDVAVSTKKERPNSLLERVSQLETSSQQWKCRVSESDASTFTATHRMVTSVPGAVPMPGLRSPSLPKKTPAPKVFKSKTGGNIPEMVGTARKELFSRSISQPDSQEETVVAVPKLDDESFNSFFTTASGGVITASGGDAHIQISQFDDVTRNSSELLVTRKNVRVTRKQQTKGNPLRALATRENIKSEYTEIKLGVGDRELRRMKVEEISKSSSFAMEALAGLASKENFSAVALKKTDQTPVTRDMPPYSSLMLIRIKGRRHPQVKLVPAEVRSMCSNDDYILITPGEIFHYKGEFSNVIERAVASDIVQYLVQTKDMGISADCTVTEISADSSSSNLSKFWKLLGGNESSSPPCAGLPDDDDMYESALVASNKIYEVVGSSLVPVDHAWGQSPKHELLHSDKVLVLDFGSEAYLWAGKFVGSESRRMGTNLLKELWTDAYDYSDCDINPVDMTLNSECRCKGKRPSWGICGKITENVETILFKEKFIDWPDMAQRSRLQEVEKENTNKHDPVSELDSCDVSKMLNDHPVEPDLVLEMSHLGRGVEYYDAEERRLSCIATKEIRVWHVSENEKTLLKNYHFYSTETYVVRWYYNITNTGRTLKGTPSKHNMTGRTRVAYFFWQGSGSSISDKGVSALMTVELDEERGPQIRVPMGFEPPAFLNLFQGGLVVHSGKEKIKMFAVRGNADNEAHVVQVELTNKNFRSRGCSVIVDGSNDKLYVWIGSKAMKHIQKVALHAASKLCKCPVVNLTSPNILEEDEGRESSAFLTLLGSNPDPEYYSLVNDSRKYDETPRFWRLEAIHGNFEATEISSAYRNEECYPFPILQEELYNSQQPGLFLIDTGINIWLWQGPLNDSDSATGSANLRFNFARRAAFQTAINYSKEKQKQRPKEELLEPKLVIAGLEPVIFTNLFPYWYVDLEIRKLQEKEGRYQNGKYYSVSQVLSKLSKKRYSLDDLLCNPKPDGVDHLRLEEYLSDAHFEYALGMNRHHFYALQQWKQIDIKKKAKLF